jgi:hypothetical protein
MELSKAQYSSTYSDHRLSKLSDDFFRVSYITIPWPICGISVWLVWTNSAQARHLANCLCHYKLVRRFRKQFECSHHIGGAAPLRLQSRIWRRTCPWTQRLDRTRSVVPQGRQDAFQLSSAMPTDASNVYFPLLCLMRGATAAEYPWLIGACSTIEHVRCRNAVWCEKSIHPESTQELVPSVTINPIGLRIRLGFSIGRQQMEFSHPTGGGDAVERLVRRSSASEQR